MLGLKSSLFAYVAGATSKASVLDLPSEVLDLVFDSLYNAGQCRLDAIIPASRVCWLFRKSALPLMFESVSIVIHDNTGPRPQTLLQEMLKSPHLLRHVKKLQVRSPLLLENLAVFPSGTPVFVQNREDNIKTLKSSLECMPQLRWIRIRCSLASAVDILRILPPKDDLIIIFDCIRHSLGAETAGTLIVEFKALSQNRTVGIGHFYASHGVSLMENEDADSLSFNRALAIALDIDSSAQEVDLFIGDPHSGPFLRSLANVEELWLTVYRRRLHPKLSWADMMQSIPWERLRRLSLHSRLKSTPVQNHLGTIVPRLKNLECLRLRAEGLIPYHVNCPRAFQSVHSDVNYPYLDLDFTLLPKLQMLEIDGICNHVPIRNLVWSGLRVLKLHRPHATGSTLSPESQRSPNDLAMASMLAPKLERLELDIGYIENLWNPTAIPGVDVDVELYRFLEALGRFRRLKFLRLYPPYVAKEHLNHSLPEYRQPLSDEQAVRMFHHLRNERLALEVFSISPSAKFKMPSCGFNAMSWEVRPLGEKTILTTRQQGKEYEQRQVWVGARRLTTGIKRFAYHKRQVPDSEGWMLTSV